jgi:hypothetical protein
MNNKYAIFFCFMSEKSIESASKPCFYIYTTVCVKFIFL